MQLSHLKQSEKNLSQHAEPAFGETCVECYNSHHMLTNHYYPIQLLSPILSTHDHPPFPRRILVVVRYLREKLGNKVVETITESNKFIHLHPLHKAAMDAHNR